MSEPKIDWDPRAESVLADQERAYDDMRRRCPVAYSEFLGWSIFRHADVLRVLRDHETFSNVVSAHRAVPNGMDPPEHTAYRLAIEGFFSRERMAQFEPVCRELARALLAKLPVQEHFDFTQLFALPFSAACQCAFLGWPSELMTPVIAWTRASQAATLQGVREELAVLSGEFAAHIRALLDRRRAEQSSGGDVTSELTRTQVDGRPLTDEELTGILRNWTVGEVGSMAAALGIVVRRLALDPELQQRLRSDVSLLPSATEEALRISGPLVANRRVAKREVELGGRTIRAGERVTVMWISANRDELAFERATELQLDREPDDSLLYGTGIHVCPGAPLARLELNVALEESLRLGRFELAARATARRATYPANGWDCLPVRFEHHRG